MGDNIPNIDPDDLRSSRIVRVREDSASNTSWPDVRTVVVSGYLKGPIPDPDGDAGEVRWQLYRTLALDEYLEFKWGDVVHIENASHIELDGNGISVLKDPPDILEPSIIWLNVTARVSLGDFLIGQVADMYLPHADIAAKLGGEAAAGRLFQGRSGAGCSRNPACGE